jgi:branched-chain amino acid transport system ATP-binding protein
MPAAVGVPADAVPLVELEEVTKSFGGLTVIDDLSLRVREGEALGVIGPNGAGKTTMLNLIAGDLRPDQGRVRIAGEDVTRLRADQRCHTGLARTAQVPRPYAGMSVFENVLVSATFGGRRRRSERAGVGGSAQALERTRLIAKANLPAGSLTLLERKQLELARALAAQPRLLLLDEIAGGLTEGEIGELGATVAAIRAEGVALIWIEHVVHALVAGVERIMAIHFGQVIADGEPDTVMASPEVREVYLGMVPTA